MGIAIMLEMTYNRERSLLYKTYFYKGVSVPCLQRQQSSQLQIAGNQK